MIFRIYLVQTVQVELARFNKQKHHDFHNKTISMALLFGFPFIKQSLKCFGYSAIKLVRQNKP